MRLAVIGTIFGLFYFAPCDGFADDLRRQYAQAGLAGSFSDLFNNLIQESISAHPQLTPAFETCLKIVSVYQANLISRLDHDASVSPSKSQQLLLLNRVASLRSRMGMDQRVACAKQFLISLRPIPETSYYKDTLILMEGHFNKGKEIEIIRAAKGRLDDMTSAGAQQLASEVALSKLNQNNLRMEITSPERDSNVIYDYLACLLPMDWVSWFSADQYCHGSSLETALSNAARPIP